MERTPRPVDGVVRALKKTIVATTVPTCVVKLKVIFNFEPGVVEWRACSRP